MSMEDMDMAMMADNTTMTSSMMSMAFFTSHTTPLYSLSWTPTSVGSYAGTCIFLIILAVVFRALFALKIWQERRWLRQDEQRRYVTVAGKPQLAERITKGEGASGEFGDFKNLVVSENGVEENVVVVKRKGAGEGLRPWRVSVDPVRAALDTVIAGVGYLLMLAVMTMNVGYFMSILGGIFLGSLVGGRYIALSEH